MLRLGTGLISYLVLARTAPFSLFVVVCLLLLWFTFSVAVLASGTAEVAVLLVDTVAVY